MITFPSQAMRAFTKPVTLDYAPSTGSFAIQGLVCGQPVCIIAGPASLAVDDAPCAHFSSKMSSVADISDIVTNEFRLQAYMERQHEEGKEEEFADRLPDWADFQLQEDAPLLSEPNLGDFIIDTAPLIHPFASTELARANLTRANVFLTEHGTEMVATDGHRLQVAAIDTAYVSGEDTELILDVPSKLLSALKLSGCMLFECRESACILTCYSEDYEVITVAWKTAGERFPAWRAVVPDVDDDSVFFVEHNAPEFGKIPASCRKGDMTVHLLSANGRSIPTFGVMDDDTIVHVISKGGPDLMGINYDDTQCYLTVKAKYAWSVGKHLKKLPVSDVSLAVSMKENAPLRIDWARGDVQYTHVLMPLRNGSTNAWPGGYCATETLGENL